MTPIMEYKKSKLKILIAADMEGVSGLTHFDQVTPGHAEWQRFRKIMTGDVNAAVRGALEAGATEIVVTDGHWDGCNILIEDLDPHARLNSGSPSPLSMVEGANESDLNAAFFVGYHARIGTQNAILDHTWSSVRVQNLRLNGKLVGETGLNAALCGYFDIPVLLVTGDQSLAAEAREWIPGVETAIVKQAHGRSSAELLPIPLAHKRISEAAAQAVVRFRSGKAPAPLKVQTPITLGLEFFYSDMADRAALLPGCKRLDGRQIELMAATMPEAYAAFRAAVTLAAR